MGNRYGFDHEGAHYSLPTILPVPGFVLAYWLPNDDGDPVLGTDANRHSYNGTPYNGSNVDTCKCFHLYRDNEYVSHIRWADGADGFLPLVYRTDVSERFALDTPWARGEVHRAGSFGSVDAPPTYATAILSAVKSALDTWAMTPEALIARAECIYRRAVERDESAADAVDKAEDALRSAKRTVGETRKDRIVAAFEYRQATAAEVTA